MGTVELRQYDPDWETAFATEADRIETVAGLGLLDVFHIGSTAIPALDLAKPVVDILAIYASRPAVDAAKTILQTEYRVHRDEPDRVALILDREDLSFTIHLRPQGTDGWQDQLVFREYLRDDPEARAMYEGAKRTAAATHPEDVSAYTAAKAPVIERLLDQAYDAGYADRVPELDPTA